MSSARRVEELGFKWLHVDIMDGHFVPNLTFGPEVVRRIRDATDLFLDTHLMLSRPTDFIEPFAEAGSDSITVHLEVLPDPAEALREIRRRKVLAGLAINPDTPFEGVRPWLAEMDLLLIMTVQPGFGGQSFREDALSKVEQARQARQEGGLSFRIEVDGGVNGTTGKQCLAAGADVLVAGTAFFKAADPITFAKDLVEGK